MFKVNSERARKVLAGPRFIKSELASTMKRFPGDGIVLWADLEREHSLVKNLSFFGEFSEGQKIILESMASLLIGKPITSLDTLTFRECEAFLRDKNSEMAFEGMSEVEEKELKKVFQWLRVWPTEMAAEKYHFSSEKGPFSQLKTVDKIKELKAFLNSPEILTLYQGVARPELVDVQELTVYIQAPYESQRDKSLFHELHLMGVGTFQEEHLNFIPEG